MSGNHKAPDTKKRRQRGSIMLMTAVTITGMIGMLALSIDLGFIFSVRSQFQNGIDSAAVSGATGLRAAIEQNAGMPQQESVVKGLAIQYAGLNQVRRYNDPDPNSGQPNTNNIVLSPSDITVSVGTENDMPTVLIKTGQEMPLLFAGIFGFSKMTVNVGSKSSLFPVDGGTGTMGGCWRPILIPDTFYDADGNVRYIGDPARASAPLPDQAGDYYRSRFAMGGRNVSPFVDSVSGTIGPSVTGLRDTQAHNDIGVKTIIGLNVEFPRTYYRIADLTTLPRATYDALSIGDLANFGYCGEVRVGTDLPVFAPNDFTTYDQVRIGLESLKYRTNDTVDNGLRTDFKYIKSASYPGPNTHAAIIPVLLFDPVELARNPAPSQLRVTNIGLFYLDEIRSDGTLRGTFVREIITGGTPIDSSNYAPLTGFEMRWLPMSVRLVR